MKEALEQIRTQALSAIAQAENSRAVEDIKVKFLGKKGELTSILKQMGKLSAEERPVIGQLANQIRSELEQAIAAAQQQLKEKQLQEQIQAETLDVTMPGRKFDLGKKHPLTLVMDEIKEILFGHGIRCGGRPGSGAGLLQL